MPSSILENKIIFITSNEPWSDIWYSKQNYAFELAKKNKVYFWNPTSKWRPKGLFSLEIKENIVSENLSIINYMNFLPVRTKWLNWLNNKIVSKRICGWMKQKNIAKIIFWSFDPIRLYNPKLFNSELSIYHCVDFYNFQFFGEDTLCKNSDIIFVNSVSFKQLFEKYNKPVILIPHAISSEEFNLNTNEMEEVQQELRLKNVRLGKFGLYIGKIDNRIDFKITSEIITKFPQTQFLFIGPVVDTFRTEFERMSRLNSNIVYLGPKPYKKLKYYTASSEFCFLFMNMGHIGFTFQSHKTLIYLAQKKPVFISSLTEYSDLKDVLYLYNNQQDLEKQLSNFLEKGEKSTLSEKRGAYVREFLFDSILVQIESAIEKYCTFHQ